MRRKITLYIDGRVADISDDSFLLYNYAFTDVDNPAAVRNSFSKQITLPGTGRNAKIFGNYERPDRVVTAPYGTNPHSGVCFNPLQETPFEIYSDKGERLENGYLRLDSVVTKGRLVTGYKVTLFGGLGSFFYAMAYNDDGTKKTLASLPYLGGSDTELDFAITATNVSNAWARLFTNPSGVTHLWDVINFAPAYNGQPDGDFSPNKGYGRLSDLGLSTQSGYNADSDGCTIVKLSKGMDEWAVKDLRSYLQRPVVSFRSILKGIKTHAASLDFDFDYSDIPTAEYKNLWLTLPLIPSLGSFRQTSGSLSASYYSSFTTNNVVGDITLSGITTFAGVQVKAGITLSLEWGGNPQTGMKMVNRDEDKCSFVCIQILAYSGASLIGGSDVWIIGDGDVTPTTQTLKAELGYNPQYATDNWHYKGMNLHNSYLDGEIEFPPFTVTGADSYKVRVDAFECEITGSGHGVYIDYSENLYSPVPTFWKNNAEVEMEECEYFIPTGVTNEFTYTSPGSFRSGVTVGKAELLATAHTPADYLIGWAKMNGLCFLYDAGARTVKLVRRNTFFNTGQDILDITSRIDRSKDVTVTPLFASARWYELSQGVAEGGFAKSYKDTYGIAYGMQRIDTSYAFNAETKKILEGLPFKAAVPSLANGRYWNIVKTGGNMRPSPFIDADNKYTLWNYQGEAKEFDITPISPATANVTYYNNTYPGYDVQGVSRLEFCDKEGKAVDGEDVLVTYEGYNAMSYFQLTDDTQLMLNANDGVPCWRLGGSLQAGINIPIFSRYHIVNSVAQTILDFGKTKETNVPGVGFRTYSCSIYERRWRLFLSDRYNKDTKVLKCRVDLEGLQVGPELLRRFFWFANSIWVLNKITNYSLTSYDSAECEFIQVRNKYNYTNGQTW